ncbi:unnamed protein product [Blepharisma stoltei]|uniref:Tetratricopeptide repeat protein n=1 Tax=Blepharisma stoltei TaxID=1481888 RepID=A0AAU9K6Y5_9CILI|nr:unnamed protein product [Blepharisma stoltei]
MEKVEYSLEKAILHNKFGSFCLKAGRVEKAVKHFNDAISICPPDILFSNVHVNLANAYLEEKKTEEAKIQFQLAIEKSPYNQPDFQGLEINPSLHSLEALSESYANLAVLYMNKDELDTAHNLLLRSIQLKSDSEANVNLGHLLRQLNRKEEAIEYAWSQAEAHARKDGAEFIRPTQLEPKHFELPPRNPEDTVHVVCVKWGSKYGPDYVNKLYHGVKRHVSGIPYDFCCFTENPEGLDEGIRVVPLAENWSGWWGKATLFSEHGLEGRLVYIDLDTVITGSLNDLLSYPGVFAVMGTSDIACEKEKNSYNTSIIAWHSSFGKEIYTTLRQNYKYMLKFICRFDHWTEMMVKDADLVQEVFPGQFLDYLTYCKESVPEGCRMVCFPRDPKPHDYKSEWIRELWN